MNNNLERIKSLCVERLSRLGLGSCYLNALNEEMKDIQLWKQHKSRDVAKELLDAATNSSGPVNSNASGSVILFLLGISSVDPISNEIDKKTTTILHGDPPDIDTDFHPAIRQRVKNRIVEMFGESKTCSIGTYSTYKTRAVILDVARALGYDVGEANAVTRTIESLKKFETGDGEEEIVDKMSLDELCEHYPELNEYLQRYPEVYTHAKVLRNQVRNMGKHAGGVIISDIDLTDKIPVQSDGSGGSISSWAESGETAELSAVGFVKYDILGLNNLPIISDCVRMIEENRGIRIKRSELPLDDKQAIKDECKGDLKGIFQFENPATKPIVDDVGVESLRDVSAVTSLLRPGPKDMGMHKEYADRKKGKEFDVLPCLKQVFDDTYGIMVYQEQIMQVSQVLCGFDGPKSNLLRKACITLDAEFISRTRGPITVRRMLKEGYKYDYFAQKGPDGTVCWAKISDIWKTGKKRVRRTKTRSGHYTDATRLHQFLTDDGWKAQQRIANDDRLLCARRLEWDGEDKETSRDLMVVMAGLLTEGYTPKNRNTATFVNHDKFFMDLFIEAFEREFGVEGGRLSPCGTVYVIRASSCKKIFKTLKQGLSADKFIPDVMMGATLETTRQYLSFMIGAEGGFTKSQGTFEYCSKSPRMIRQVKTLLLRFGIRSSSGIKEDSTYGQFYRLFVNDMQEQKKMFRELSKMWPPWKIDTLQDILSKKSAPNFSTDTIPCRVVKRMLNQYPSVGRGQSGTFYTASISRNRFARAAQKTKDKEWIQLANADFWFDEYRGSDEIVSVRKNVYDFRVQDKSLPNMIVNGMVVHNCGKKKKDLMASIKEEFIAGAQPRIDAGEVTKEQVEVFWRRIVTFARYGFNRSHAITYSMISTAEMWLKQHYFIEYMTALAMNTGRKSERHGSSNMLADYLNYVRKRGVDVLPPSVNAPKPDFYIDDNAIRYGLAHIKNVASAAQAIAAIAAETPFTSMTDFHERCVYDRTVKSGPNAGSKKSTKPNKQAVESLIYAGAFDEFGSRNDVLHEYYMAKMGVPEPTSEEIETERQRLLKDPNVELDVNNPDCDLSVVKGVGADPAQAIASIVATQPFESMADFHERCVFEREIKSGKNKGDIKKAKPTKKAVESLIYAGAFDAFGDVRGVLRAYHMAKEKYTPPDTSERELEKLEVQRLGLCLSKEPIRLRYHQTVEEQGWKHLDGAYEDTKRVIVFGRVEKITPKTSSNGNAMFIVTMSDDMDEIDFFVFTDAMDYIRDHLRTDQLAAVPLSRFEDTGTRFFDDRREVTIIEEQK